MGDSREELTKLPAKSADLIFIDSFHSEDQIREEFKRSEKLIRQGGLILMHNYYSSEISLWVDYIKQFSCFEIMILNTPENRGLAIAKCMMP